MFDEEIRNEGQDEDDVQWHTVPCIEGALERKME